jgi:hypothetical protein
MRKADRANPIIALQICAPDDRSSCSFGDHSPVPRKRRVSATLSAHRIVTTFDLYTDYVIVENPARFSPPQSWVFGIQNIAVHSQANVVSTAVISTMATPIKTAHPPRPNTIEKIIIPKPKAKRRRRAD